MSSQSRTKTHVIRSESSGISASICGMVGVRGATEEPTCALCRRELDRLRALGVAAHEVPRVIPDAGDGTRWDESLAPIAAAPLPGRVARRYRWPSVSRALEAWARARVDGYSARSLHGVTEALGRDGVRVDGGQPCEPSAMRQADDCADVEACLEHVFGHVAWEGLLDARAAFAATLWRWVASDWADVRVRRDVRREAVQLTPEAIADRLDMEDVTPRVVKRTTDRAMRYLRVEMVARGLVPPRRTPPGGASAAYVAECAAVEARRAALRGGQDGRGIHDRAESG